MLIDPKYGFAPPEWQSYVGPVLAYRPQIGGQSVQNFNRLDFEIVWDFLNNVLDRFGEPHLYGDLVPNRDFKFEKLRDYTENFCSNRSDVKLEEQNITRGEF